MKEVSAMRFATTLLLAAAAIVASVESKAGDEVTIRNTMVLDTAHESWAVATAVNNSREELLAPVITVVLPDGTKLKHVGPSRVGPGETWRIKEVIPGSKGMGKFASH